MYKRTTARINFEIGKMSGSKVMTRLLTNSIARVPPLFLYFIHRSILVNTRLLTRC